MGIAWSILNISFFIGLLTRIQRSSLPENPTFHKQGVVHACGPCPVRMGVKVPYMAICKTSLC